MGSSFRISCSFVLLTALALVAGCADPREVSAGSTAADTSSTTRAGLTQDDVLSRLKGPFTGGWTMFGVDAQGAPREVTHWTDTVTVSEPKIEADKITIEAVDAMVYAPGGAVPSCPDPNNRQCQQWQEGYFRNPDGSFGDRFVILGGVTSIAKEISPNTFTVVETAATSDLEGLGFTHAVSGKHVTVKVVTTDGSIDTERISRVTTVEWKDATGADRFTQMITLQGQHQHTH